MSARRCIDVYKRQVLPYVKEFPLLNGTGETDGITKESLRWSHGVKNLWKRLGKLSETEGGKKEGDAR